MHTLYRAGFLGALCSCLFATTALAEAPPRWSCDETWYEDGVCDCGCGAVDRDCAGDTFEVCERSGCATGQVPWEHNIGNCMISACGDGWRDEAMGEACDDFEALSGGGCAADCSTVNAGWICGERAEGCEEDPDAPAPDTGVPDVGTPDAASMDGGDAAREDAVGDDSGGDAAVAAPDVGADTGSEPSTSSEDAGSSGGCSSAGGRAGATWLLLPLAMLAGRRRARWSGQR